MKQRVLDELLKSKSKFNQLHGHEYHNEADAVCQGDIVELFDSVDGELTAHVCSECGAMRYE